MSPVRSFLKGYRPTSRCRCTRIICARDNVSTGLTNTSEKIVSFWKSKDCSKCDRFSCGVLGEDTAGNTRRPLTVPLPPDHLLTWSQKICGICASLVSWAARAEWKCHILSNEVRITHTRNCSSDSWRRKQDCDLSSLCFSRMFCVGCCSIVRNLPLWEVEG